MNTGRGDPPDVSAFQPNALGISGPAYRRFSVCLAFPNGYVPTSNATLCFATWRIGIRPDTGQSFGAGRRKGAFGRGSNSSCVLFRGDPKWYPNFSESQRDWCALNGPPRVVASCLAGLQCDERSHWGAARAAGTTRGCGKGVHGVCRNSNTATSAKGRSAASRN